MEICLPPLLITKDFVAPSGEEKVDLYESEVRNTQETSHLTFDVPFDDSAASEKKKTLLHNSPHDD